MSNIRSDQLVREIAGLIVKYKPSEWIPVLSELKMGSAVQVQIAKAVEDLLSRPQIRVPNKKAKKRTSTKAKIQSIVQISAQRRDILEPLRSALANRQILGNARSLKEACYSLGIKDVLPSKRNDAVQVLISFLDKVEDSKFHDAVTKVTSFQPSESSNFEEEYQRWFEMIMQSSR